MTKTISIDHLARVEGHGGIHVELDGRHVRDVRFDVFEGARLIEGLVRGRRYEDVSQIVSRICAICSVAHSLTSIKATEAAFSVRPSEQTELLRDLMFRGENIESHALHVFLLALPDYMGYPSAPAMVADHGNLVTLALGLKKLGNTIQEAVGGRAVHPVNAVVGGFGSIPAASDLVLIRDGLLRARDEVAAAVEVFAGLPEVPYCAIDTAFAAMMCSEGYGYYRGDAVVWVRDGRSETVLADEYRRLTNETVVAHSHAKHSHFEDEPFMVGALARLAVNAAALGSNAAAAMRTLRLEPPYDNPMDNNKAQLVELVEDIDVTVDTVERVLREGLVEERPAPVKVRRAAGSAVTEAPRGLLVHSYAFDGQGRVTAADVVTPTALNAASLERHIRAAVDQSEDLDGLERPLAMIARAYDPCISCSVHLVQREHVD